MRISLADQLQAQGHLEPVSLDQAGISQNLATGAVGDDLALIQQDRARADLENQLEVVRGDQLGRGKVADLMDEPPPAARVKVRRGLVEHHHRGPACQHARQADALPLAEAQMMRRTIRRVLKVDPRETLQGQAASLAPGHPLVERPEGHILDDRGAEELIVGVLEQQPHLAPDLVRRPGVDLDPLDPDAGGAPPSGKIEPMPWRMPQVPLPLPGKQAVEMEQERALARAVGTHECDALAAPGSPASLPAAPPCRRDSDTPGRTP